MINGIDKCAYEQATLDSFIAGYSFGSLIAHNNLSWDSRDMYRFLDTVHPKFPFLISHYKRGFVSGFTYIQVIELKQLESIS